MGATESADHIVFTQLLGSILSNLLLVLGCSFLAGGLKYQESNFQVTAAQNAASLMTLACISEWRSKVSPIPVLDTP